MATLDFTPLVRSSIGFDQLPALLAQALERPETTFPPYNIEKVGEDLYRIVMAVAGFARDDLEVVQEQNRLTIRGKRKGSDGKRYLHRGIATRAFEHHFDLADYVEVIDATNPTAVSPLNNRPRRPSRSTTAAPATQAKFP
jgi:molecular chaperone IbpA